MENCKLKAIASLADHTADIEVLWLYGSRAKGTASDDSDYDLAIAFRNFLNTPLESKLRPKELSIDWQYKLNLPEGKISIVDINQCPISLAWEIITANTLLCEKNHIRRMNEERRIISMYELDILHSRKKYG